jgi:hypothetical protein
MVKRKNSGVAVIVSVSGDAHPHSKEEAPPSALKQKLTKSVLTVLKGTSNEPELHGS